MSRPAAWRTPGAGRRSAAAAVFGAAWLLAGCASIQKMAVNRLGDFLAEGGSVYESDDDPDLVADALPFGLKLMESMLETSPEHPGLLLAACKGFTVYSYANVDAEAERLEDSDLDAARSERARARRLYLRAWGYGERGLAIAAREPAAILTDPTALQEVEKKDVPLLYWSAAALGLAISDSRGDAEMIARLPVVEALLQRARALNPDWEEGSLDEFDIVLAGTRPGGTPDEARLREDFERALRLSGGKRASLFVGYAEQSAVKRQDAAAFRELLDRALAIDPDAHPPIRLANLVAQRRARRLLDRIDSLFLDPDAGASGAKPERP